jgi:hypothetical protein
MSQNNNSINNSVLEDKPIIYMVEIQRKIMVSNGHTVNEIIKAFNKESQL